MLAKELNQRIYIALLKDNLCSTSALYDFMFILYLFLQMLDLDF